MCSTKVNYFLVRTMTFLGRSSLDAMPFKYTFNTIKNFANKTQILGHVEAILLLAETVMSKCVTNDEELGADMMQK